MRVYRWWDPKLKIWVWRYDFWPIDPKDEQKDYEEYKEEMSTGGLPYGAGSD